jgi:hypothetical protein
MGSAASAFANIGLEGGTGILLPVRFGFRSESGR